ncbi:MAG: PEP-CTERM system TPR-repeat protein PrsT [Gammaproteobacteria bacterium]|nr:PEP-CTERM system TPR-repeat protein PrsT [Gammaproteobacteria bacterium]
MKFHAPLALLILSCCLSACSRRHEDLQKLLNDAQTLHQRGNDSGAIIQLKNVLAQEPRNALARFRLGNIYLDTLNYAAAADYLERAREAGYDETKIDPLLARAWLGVGDFQRILDEPAPDKSNPDYPILAAARVDASLATGKLVDAQQLLNQAEAAFPDSPDLHLAHARALLLAAKPEDALQALDRALAQNPKMVDALLLKADLLRTQGLEQAAQQAYRAVLAINPHHYEVGLILARTALAQGQPDEARKLVAQVLKSSPNNLLVRYTQALIDYQGGKIEEAREELFPVLKNAPDYAPALLLSGAVEFSQCNLQQAETKLNKVVFAYPGQSFARRLLVATQLRLGKTEEAQRTLRPLSPDSSKDPAVLGLAGQIALASRQPDDAANYFQRASKLAPNNPAVLTDLGLARLDAGNEAGLADLENAAGLDKTNPRPDLLLALTYLQRKQYDQALAAITALQKKRPQDPTALNLQGAAYLGKQDFAAARQRFQQALYLDPKYSPAAANLAQLDLAQNQPEAARHQYEALIKADPNNLSVILALAQLALAEKQDTKYLAWLDKAAEMHPNAVQPRLLKAAYYLNHGSADRALIHAREAYELQPSNTAALELLGQAQLAARRPASAVNSFRKLAEMQPKSAEVQLLLARAHDADDDQNGALQHLQQAAQLSGNAPVLQAALAQQYIKMQRYDDAEAAIRALDNLPDEQSFAIALNGDIAYARKDYGAAITAYRRALALKPSNLIVLRLSQAHAAAGETAQGIAVLGDWFKVHPEDLVIANALGQR